MKKISWIIFASLCVIISFYPLKYLLADEPTGLLLSKSAELLSSNIYNIAFYAHITLGGIALLVGWLQFSEKLRRSYMSLHRTIGKIYVVSVLISGPFGFYIALFASGGLSPKLGFSVGAALWTIFTFLGYMAIRKGNVEAHKRLMTYSYAGTFGAVTLRLWLPLLIAITGSFTSAYGIVAWLSWLPNLLVVYLILNKGSELLAFYNRYRIKYVLTATVAIALAAFGLSFLSPQTWFYKNAPQTGTSFEHSSTADISSFSSEKLTEIDDYLRKESETTSMVVLENGKIIYEYGDISEINYIASCRKSVLSMLYGKYVENGKIDLNETIGELGIDDVGELLPMEKRATIDHIITSRSGVYHEAANGGYDESFSKQRGTITPGEKFVYNNWDFNVAGYILEQKSGNTVYQEIEEQLAIPLGFEDWNIKNQSRTTNEEKSKYSAYHMHFSTRDMAKIGQLMLQKGNWNGKQIISKNWINKITNPVSPVDIVNERMGRDQSNPIQESYGYMWWLSERYYDNPDMEGAYSASGYGGQFITVIPKRNVVIAHKTKIDLLTTLGMSQRSATPSWRYYWILRNLMQNRKSIAALPSHLSVEEKVEFIRAEFNADSEYAISERLINEYGQQLATESKCDEAIKFYELNLELYPQGYYTHRIFQYYGDCLKERGRREEAIRAYEQSLAFEPSNKGVKKSLLKLRAGE